MISEWKSSIAHPVLADWATVAGYVLAALLSFQAAAHSALQLQRCEMLFWRITALLLVLSAIDEPLDLQTLLTSIGRAGAHDAGWFGERREVQYVFVLALAGAGLMAALAMLRLTIGADPSMKLAWAGLVTIGLFGFLRAASIHHLDDIFVLVAKGYSWAWLAERIGILTVGTAAVLFRRRR